MLHKIDGIWYKHWETTFINNCAIDDLFINNIIEEKALPVYGDGNFTRDWLFVEDHAAAKGQLTKTHRQSRLGSNS